MVRLDGVDHLAVLLVLAADVHADLDMAALDLVVQGLADVMQQAGAAGHGDVDPQLAGQQPGQPGHLHAVGQRILPKAGAVLEPADQLDQVGVQAMDAQFHHGPLAFPLHLQLQLAAALFHRLFDAGGVDAAVADQPLQGHPGHLAAGLVEGGQGDGLGVSSMMRSTPVAVSRARMLRPSRPMIRPFISSLGRGTTVTVVSLE